MKKTYTTKIMSAVKTMFLTIILSCGFLVSKAQISGSGFSSSIGSYDEIVGGTLLGDTASDDQRYTDPAALNGSTTVLIGPGFPIGFNFMFNGVTYDVFGVNTNGWISLGSGGTVDVTAINYFALSGTANTSLNVIAALNKDLKAYHGTSNIMFLTAGTAPNRTLTVQWTDYSQYFQNTDLFDFQIILHETTNIIDFVYGDFFIGSTTASTAHVGLRSIVGDYTNRTTTTDWEATTSGATSTDACTLTTLIYPPKALTYTWTPPSACVFPPTAGTAISSSSSVCANVAFNLSLMGNSVGIGQTYQWQSSSNNINFVDILSATSQSYTDNQTTVTYYRCVVTCSGSSVNSSSVNVTSKPASLCYCTTGIGGGGCGSGNRITNVKIAGTTLHNSSAIASCNNSISSFPAADSTTADLGQGNAYSLSVSTDAATYVVSVWIDYNQDGAYDANEWTQVTTNSVLGANTINLNISSTGLLGQTGMRIRSRAVIPNGGLNACTNFGSGETEDYIVNIVANIPCVSPPTAGTISASDNSICPNTPVNFTLIGNSIGSGLTIQWQSSPDNSTWADIAGANTISNSDTLSAATYYRCGVTCSGSTAYTPSLSVTMNPLDSCYCKSYATSIADDDIGYISIGTLSNGSADTTARSNPTSINTYTDFTSLAPTSLSQGTTYPITIVQINKASFFVCNVSVFIDFNHDGSFDASETFWLGATTSAAGGNVINGTITVPASGYTGITRMRVLLRETGSATQSACGSYLFGETEDYLVNIDLGSGVKNIAQETVLNIFPNPASNNVSIYFVNKIADNTQLKLYSSNGQLVFSENMNQFAGSYHKDLDVSTYAKGIYFMQMITNKNVVTKKVVIE